jgi:hypothetical protein
MFGSTITFALMLLLVAGCKKEDNPADANGDGGSQINITIGSGRNPQYTWGGGNVFSLSVVRTASPTTIVWGLASPGQNGIASPITHGSGASGFTIVETAASEKQLATGVQYRISITRIDGTTGFKEFTP